jgi:hypothetical protein
MAEASNSNISDVAVGYFKFRLCFLQPSHLLPSEVACADAVLKSFVGGARENLVAEAELFQILKSFKLWRVYNPPTKKLRVVELTIRGLRELSVHELSPVWLWSFEVR